MNNRRYDCDQYGRPTLSSSHPSDYDSRSSSSSGAGPLPGQPGRNFYEANPEFPSQLPPYGVQQQHLNYQNDMSRQHGGYNGISSPVEAPPSFSYNPYTQNNWDPRSYPSQPPNIAYTNPAGPYPPLYGSTPSGVLSNNIQQGYQNQALQGAPYFHVPNQQSQQSAWVSAAAVSLADLTKQSDSCRDIVPSKPLIPTSDLKDEAVPLSKGKIRTSHSAEEKQPEKETKKPIPIMVGKRRGGRVLPTGVVKKQRTGNSTQGRTDAWGQYMAEVKKYKEQSCEEERKNRPLVK